MNQTDGTSLSREEYFEERKLLIEARQRGFQRAEQMVMGGATGALLLSITFLEKLVPVATVKEASLLVAAWAVLLLSLCLSMVGQYTSAWSFDVELRSLDAVVNGEPPPRNHWRSWNVRVAVGAAALLVVGTILLARFAFVNAPFNQ